MSTRHRAAGWITSNNPNIVAPSFDTVATPFLTIILSIPRGPNVVLTVSARTTHALILVSNYPVPYEVSVPSLSTTIAG